jgi:hypothetical protein
MMPCTRLSFRSSALAAALLSFAMAGALPCRAETPAASVPALPTIPDSARQKILGHLQEVKLARLQGWPSIIFYCPIEEAPSPAIKQICQESYKTLEQQAVKHRMKFRKAQNLNEVILLPQLTGDLKLVIDLLPSGAGDSASAISATISVLAHYSRAINRALDLPGPEQAQTGHPVMTPQHVDALLWDAAFIKATSGPQSELVGPVVAGINQKLEAFFADYGKANQHQP